MIVDPNDRSEDEVVCDFCASGKSPEWFTHVTPNPAETLAEAQAQDMVWFEDPEWVICSTCHRLILGEVENARDALFMRSMMQWKDVFLGRLGQNDVLEQVQASDIVRGMQDAFWAHYDGEWWPGIERRYPKP